MAGLEHLRAAVDNLINEQKNLDAIKQDIDDLKAKVGTGSVVTDQDLEALASKIDSVSSGIDTLKAAADLSKVQKQGLVKFKERMFGMTIAKTFSIGSNLSLVPISRDSLFSVERSHYRKVGQGESLYSNES